MTALKYIYIRMQRQRLMIIHSLCVSEESRVGQLSVLVSVQEERGDVAVRERVEGFGDLRGVVSFESTINLLNDR